MYYSTIDLSCTTQKGTNVCPPSDISIDISTLGECVLIVLKRESIGAVFGASKRDRNDCEERERE